MATPSRRHWTHHRIILLHQMLLAATLVAGCGNSQPGQPAGLEAPAAPAQAAAARTSPHASPGYDLAKDEALGGHTLQRHVGKSDAELADRLRREPQISAASTYTDAETASRVVAAALVTGRGRVHDWVDRTGPRPNLVLTYRDASHAEIGRSLARGTRVSRACSSARIVIRWLDRAGRWFVLTSYPEAE